MAPPFSCPDFGAHFTRYLIVKRRENLGERERDDLRQMLEYLPGLATLRRFADRIYWLFDTPKDLHQASCRRAAIVRDKAFLSVAELVKAMEQVRDEKFPKLMAYLRNPLSRRVRTNNHVERTNRMFRLLEKVRYKWRERKTLVRFVVLTREGIWREWTPPKVDNPNRPVAQSVGARHEVKQVNDHAEWHEMRWGSARSVRGPDPRARLPARCSIRRRGGSRKIR